MTQKQLNNNMISALFASIIFYLMPILIGRPIVRFLFKRSLPLPVISYFIVGAGVMYLGAILSFGLASLSSTPMSGTLVLQLALGVISFFTIPWNFFTGFTDIKLKPYILPAIVSVLLSVFVYSLWQIKSPYPFNWDLFEHQTLVNQVLHGSFSVVPSQVSDTFGFDGYSTIFHTLVAYSQAIVPTGIFEFWNTIAGVHFTLVIFSSYLLGKAATNNKQIAFLMAILGAFAFDSTISFTALFFIPQTFTALVWVFLIIQMIQGVKHGTKIPLLLVVLGITFILFSHYIIGTVAIALYLGLYLFERFEEQIKARINVKKAIEALVFLGFAAVVFTPFLSFGFLNNGEAQAFTLSFPDKFTAMRQAYGFLMLLSLPLGVWSVLKSRHKAEMYSLVILIALATLVLTGLPYVMKFYTLARIFVHLFMAIGLYVILKRVKNPILLGIAYTALIASLTVIFVSNALIWKGILHYNMITTHIAPNEVQAANFLKSNYSNTRALLVSDPATQNILETLSTVNSQGGAYMNRSSRLKVNDISSLDPKTVKKDLYSITDKLGKSDGPRLLVLSGRYFIWQNASLKDKLALNYNVWYPSDLTLSDIEQVDKLLLSSPGFKLVFQNPTMAIIEVTK